MKKILSFILFFITVASSFAFNYNGKWIQINTNDHKFLTVTNNDYTLFNRDYNEIDNGKTSDGIIIKNKNYILTNNKDYLVLKNKDEAIYFKRYHSQTFTSIMTGVIIFSFILIILLLSIFIAYIKRKSSPYKEELLHPKQEDELYKPFHFD